MASRAKVQGYRSPVSRETRPPSEEPPTPLYAADLRVRRIQPDPRPHLELVGPHHFQNRSIVPPYGGREDGEPAEDARIPQSRFQGDQAPQRGTADAAVRGRHAGTVPAVDEGLQLVRHHPGVALALAAFAAARVLG